MNVADTEPVCQPCLMGLRTLMHLTVTDGIPLSFDSRKPCKIAAAVSRLLALANAKMIMSTINITIAILTPSSILITMIVTITIEVAGAGC